MTGSGGARGSGPASPARQGPGLAVLTALGQTIGTTIVASDVNLLGYALLVVSGLMLADRHKSPRTTLVLTAVATVAYVVLGYPLGLNFLAVLIAAAVANKAGHRGAVAAVAVLAFAAWVLLTGADLHRALTVAVWMAGLGLLFEVVLRAGTVIGQAAGEQRRLQEERKRLQAERTRRKASEERLRIAQELHDVLGHHLSLINVRAGIGLHLMGRQPEQAEAALDTIKHASAEALREVQSVLNALYPSGQAAPRAPAPGLDRLDDLTVDAGLQVRTTVTGEPGRLPAEIDRAAYRIVQEALTNVRRHAGAGAAATITLDHGADRLVIQVEDDGGAGGPVLAPAAEGNGISGMRERAIALDGTLTAAPLPAGGWRVRATLPLASPAEPVSPQLSELEGGA